jgi:hypothetical protein
VDALLMALRRVTIGLTHRVHRRIEGGGVLIALMIEPVDRAMRLEIGLLLKNALRCGAKSSRQCPV